MRCGIRQFEKITMKPFFISLIFLTLTVAQATASAEVLVIGVSTGYPPYYYKENGKLTGFCVDLADSVASIIGLEVVYKEFPWKRLILSARKGDVDAIMPLFKTKEREEYLLFNGLELAFEKIHFFTIKDFPVSYIGSFEQISDYRIGVVTNYSYGKTFDNFRFSKKVVTLNDKHLIEMFINKRFEIGVGNKYVVQHYANQAGFVHSIKFLDPPISEEMLYLGFAKMARKDALAEKFAKVLRAFKDTDEYDILTEKYGITGKNNGNKPIQHSP